MKKNFKIFISSIIIIFSLITISNSVEPTSGAYVTDKATVPAARAYIDAFQPVQLLDYFLCVSKNHPENHPNSAWKTLTDQNACMLKSGLSQPSNDKNATTPQFVENIYSSTRASNTAEQVVLGFEQNKDGHAILGKGVLTSAPTESNPNGASSLFYDVIEPSSGHTLGDAKGKYNISANSDGSISVTLAVSHNHNDKQFADMIGSSTGITNLMFNPRPNIVMLMNADLKADSSTGKKTLLNAIGQTSGCLIYGFTQNSSTGEIDLTCGPSTASTISTSTGFTSTPMGSDHRYLFNLDGSFAHMQEIQIDSGGNESVQTAKCYNIGNATEIAYDYDLYDKSSGDLLEFNGPFPFTTVSDNKNGFFSYWGAWVDSRDITAGEQIQKSDGTTYTTGIASGTMQKREYVASTIPATAYATGANLEAHVCVTIGADHMCNWANIKFGIDSGTMKIYADGAVTGFVSDGEELMTAYEGFHYYDQSTYMPYNISVIGTANSSGNRGNSVSIKYDRVTASDWSTLYSTATEVEFYCYGACPLPPAGAGWITEASFKNRPTQDSDPGSTPMEYVLKKSDMSFYYKHSGGDRYVGPSSYTPSGGNSGHSHNWWWTNGTFIPKSGGTKSSWSDIFDSSSTPITYNYETTDSPYGKPVFAKTSGGDFVTIDKPKRFQYTHSTANDRNDSSDNNGKTYNLEYGGEGRLWGFSWSCPSSGGPCSPSVALKDGTEFDIDGDGTTDYVALGKRLEKRIPEAASASSCSSLPLIDIATDYPLPSLPTSSEISTQITHTTSDAQAWSLISNDACYIDGVRQTNISGCN